VAHKPAAASMLAQQLDKNTQQGQKTLAVFAVMKDKDIQQIVQPLSEQFSQWYCGVLEDNDRAAPVEQIAEVLKTCNQAFKGFSDITQAFEQALNDASEHDRIVVFGSFFTVAAVQQYIRTEY